MMPAKLEAHGRHQLVGEISLAARRETLIQRGAEHRHRHGFVDGSGNSPAALARIRYPPLEVLQLRAVEQRQGGQVEQPRSNDAAAPPDFSHVWQVELVLV